MRLFHSLLSVWGEILLALFDRIDEEHGLDALRGLGESYSHGILAVAKGEV